MSEESELSEPITNYKTAHRVSVCLKRYFEDVRSRCYIKVVKNRRVRWLEKRIQKIFSLPGDFCLCSNGHFLPSSEPLALLRPEDVIEVVPLGSHSANVAILQEAMSNDADESMVSIYAEEYWGPSNIIPSSEINGARTSYEVSSPNNNNGCHETTDAPYTLQQLKRRALDLLDAQLGPGDTVDAAADEPPRRRARRRVRRRVRHLTPGPNPGTEPTPSPNSERVSERGLESSREPEPSSSIYSESEPTSVSPEVARNESARARPPRVVSSLQSDD